MELQIVPSNKKGALAAMWSSSCPLLTIVMSALNLKIATVILCSIMAFGSTTYAQRGFELGAGLGVGYYFGDLNTNYSLAAPGPAGTLIARYNFNNRISLKFSGNYGFFRADDATSENQVERERNLNFRTHTGDLSTQLEFNFFPFIHGSRNQYFTPYLFAGLSLYRFNPYATYNGERTPFLRELGTEGQPIGEEYAIVANAINFGGGFKFDISTNWSINIEASFRRLFTDYFDDVSTTYPDLAEVRGFRGSDGAIAALAADPSVLLDPPSEVGAKEGFQRGDPNTQDSYNFLTVGVVRYFGSLRCPDVSRIK